MNDESPFSLPRVLESILFASQKPLSGKELTNILKGAAEAAKERPEIACFGKVKAEDIAAAMETLEAEYTAQGRAFELRESAAGWQLVTRPDYAPWLRQLFPENKAQRLSAPALETLAIIAYRQPITRADIEAVRGVAVDGVMQTLLDRGLVRIAGRAEIAGRPLLYETTQFFMEHFGLKDLDELPNAGELRKIALPTAAAPETPAPEVSDTPTEDVPAGPLGEEAPVAEEPAPPEAEEPVPAEETEQKPE